MAICSKSEFARRCGVTPGAITNWIRRGKLTAPALTVDGQIDVALADQMLPTFVRRAAPAPRRRPVIRRNLASETSGPNWTDPPGGQPPVAADDAEAADRRHGQGRPPGDRHDREEIVVAVDDLPRLAAALQLDRGQVAKLSRFFGRRTA
jgi:hypothetical protein